MHIPICNKSRWNESECFNKSQKITLADREEDAVKGETHKPLTCIGHISFLKLRWVLNFLLPFYLRQFWTVKHNYTKFTKTYMQSLTCLWSKRPHIYHPGQLIELCWYSRSPCRVSPPAHPSSYFKVILLAAL